MFGRGKKTAQSNQLPRRAVPSQQPLPESFSYYRSTRRNQTMGDVRRQEIAIAERRDGIRIAKMLVVLVILAVAIIKILYVTGSAKVDLSDNGYAYRSSASYEQIVNDGLKQSLWQKNKLTFDDVSLKEYLAQYIPELERAEIIIPLINNRPVIKLSFLPPGLVLATGKAAYVVTNTGRIVSPITESESQPQVPQVNDAGGTAYNPGEYGFAESSVQFIQELQNQFSAKKIAIVSMTIPAGSIEELRVVPTGVGYSVRFDMTGEAVQQAGTYLAAREYLKENGLVPREYVDARTLGKVFFK